MKLIVLPLALALTGCGSVLRDNREDAQAVVDKRVVGMPVGDFIQRYGRPSKRVEANDGSLTVDWQAEPDGAVAGPRGLEDSICRLRLSASRAGRILAAPITQDGRGQRRLSLCAELFEAS
ncbi:MAG: hypothetical protein M3Y67_01490 [Pseudomonadota bacterium]|nr:hypothetical protein [Pseudomonadota bacterium]